MLLMYILFTGLCLAHAKISIELRESDELRVDAPLTLIKIKWLGGGATGSVYLVSYGEGKNAREFALKVGTTNNKNISEIKNEFLALQKLKGKADHLKPAGILQAFGHGECTGDVSGYGILLQYIDSPHLGSLGFESDGSIPEILLTGIDLIRILEVIHKEGVIHGDIKPRNILYSNPENRLNAVLIDFGLANFKGTTLNQAYLYGTFQFMSPNILNGGCPTTDDDLRSLLYVLAKAGFRGGLPWGFQSILLKLPFSPSKKNNLRIAVNKKKADFENELETKNIHPNLIEALVAIRTYLATPRERRAVVDYTSIIKVFESAHTSAVSAPSPIAQPNSILSKLF